VYIGSGIFELSVEVGGPRSSDLFHPRVIFPALSSPAVPAPVAKHILSEEEPWVPRNGGATKVSKSKFVN